MAKRRRNVEYEYEHEEVPYVIKMFVYGGIALGVYGLIKNANDPKRQQNMNRQQNVNQNQTPFRPFNPQGFFRGGIGEQY